MKAKQKFFLEEEVKRSILEYFDKCNFLTLELRNLICQRDFSEKRFKKIIEIICSLFENEISFTSKIRSSKSLKELLANLPELQQTKLHVKLKNFKKGSNKNSSFITTNKSIFPLLVPIGGQNKKK